MNLRERACRECGDKFAPKQNFHWMCGKCAARKFGWDEPPTGAGFGARRAPRANGAGLAVTIAAEFAVNLDRLIRLCHPDKHGNSVSATAMTQWLLEKRDQLKRIEKGD